MSTKFYLVMLIALASLSFTQNTILFVVIASWFLAILSTIGVIVTLSGGKQQLVEFYEEILIKKQTSHWIYNPIFYIMNGILILNFVRHGFMFTTFIYLATLCLGEYIERVSKIAYNKNQL